METRNLDSWGDFRPTIEDLSQQYSRGERNRLGVRREILFRGVANAERPLATTLERAAGASEFGLNRYYMYASMCVHELESVTGKRWSLPDWPDINAHILSEQSSLHAPLPHLDYLVYLRHHGFPSPLLDWTTSAYVAAYFAFHSQPESPDARVAVYAFVEAPSGAKTGWAAESAISSIGKYVTTDVRHFAQKARYTVATRWDEADQRHHFASHIEVFDRGRRDQDVLLKLTMPASDRRRALAELNDYNINHYTLFQTEDALVRALAINEFELAQTEPALPADVASEELDSEGDGSE